LAPLEKAAVRIHKSSAIFTLWKTLRSIGITGKSNAIKPVADGLGIPVASCRQAELALADL
jgi:hypothetical protein